MALRQALNTEANNNDDGDDDCDAVAADTDVEASSS